MSREKKHRNMKKRLKITIVVAIIALLICGAFFVLARLHISHMRVFLLFSFILSVLVLTYMVLWTLAADEKYSRLIKILKLSYFVCLIIGILCFLILLGLIISGAHTDEDRQVDAVIVLGAGLINDKPSLILEARLDAALAYLQTQEDIPVIVTGGLGQGQSITEGEAMARYLIARGLDETRIWKEEASTSTHENIKFAIEIMTENSMNAEKIKVAIISNDFHLYRARLIAEKAGLDAIGVVAETPGLHRKVIYYFREPFSLAKELLFR